MSSQQLWPWWFRNPTRKQPFGCLKKTLGKLIGKKLFGLLSLRGCGPCATSASNARWVPKGQTRSCPFFPCFKIHSIAYVPGTKEWKMNGDFDGFPCSSALFGLVSYNDSCQKRLKWGGIQQSCFLEKSCGSCVLIVLGLVFKGWCMYVYMIYVCLHGLWINSIYPYLFDEVLHNLDKGRLRDESLPGFCKGMWFWFIATTIDVNACTLNEAKSPLLWGIPKPWFTVGK